MALPHSIFQGDMQLSTSVRTHRRSATDDLDTTDSKSLLSVKHHLILFYLESLVPHVAQRAAGDTLETPVRPPASLPLNTRHADRVCQGGDFVDS